MNHDAIQGIIRKKIKELSRLSKKIGNGFDKEAIHSFRLSAKTLRSFLRLLRMHTHEPGLKMTKKFKRLYHITGAIRDAQLQLEKINEKKLDLPKYKGKLQKMIEQQQHEWQKHYTGKICTRLGTKLLSYKFDNMEVQVLEDFIKSRAKHLQQLGKTVKPTESQVHNGRKRAKDILYTSNLAMKKWEEARRLIKHTPLEQFEIIAELIGNYHDETVALQRLNSFSPKGITDDEKDKIKSMCRENALILSEEKTRILSAIKKIATQRKK